MENLSGSRNVKREVH